MARNYTLTQTGAEVQSDLDKIEGAKIEGGTITIDGVSITPVTEETDPTVPDWAKTPAKPEYTAEEVGALPEDTTLAELPTDASHRAVTDTEKAIWNGKQDAIADLDDIRSGAGAGATAVQPSQMQTALAGKQDTLVSGQNIKTINGNSLLGSGDLEIQGGGGTSEIFIAEYGVSTFSEISSAHNAGKMVFLKVPRAHSHYTEYAVLLGLDDSGATFGRGFGVDPIWDVYYVSSADGWSSDRGEIIEPSELSQLSDDANHRLVTDAEKATWNNIKGVFIAEDGVTPFADIYAAYQAGKLVVADSYGTIGQLGNIFDNYALFVYPVQDDCSIGFAEVTGNGWEYPDWDYWVVAGSERTAWNAKYDKPSGGIPKTDLASAVQTSLGKADTALQSFTETDPIFLASAAHGITSSDITAWNAKYTKPANGIPGSDLASGVIPTIESLTTAEIDTIWNAS